MDGTLPPLDGTLRDNIARLSERQRRETAAAPLSDRIAARITGFTGSMTFVALHVTLFGGWIVWNLWLEPKFDPSFVVLAMIASVEAIFLSTFVLISQNRMARLSQARADLDLHISLLAEHELSRLAALVERIAANAGIEVPADIAEIKNDVVPEAVLDTLAKVTPDAP
jgi:uncharacterized membrane protein